MPLRPAARSIGAKASRSNGASRASPRKASRRRSRRGKAGGGAGGGMLELEGVAVGASRERLLRALARRMPEAALVREAGGFILGRDGGDARQLGPLVARDAGTAKALLAQALRLVEPPIYVDDVDHAPGLPGWRPARGG